MDFCLRGKGWEARSSQISHATAGRRWFESLLLVWWLYSRIIRLAARFSFCNRRGQLRLAERNLSVKGSHHSPQMLALAVIFLRRSLLTSY